MNKLIPLLFLATVALANPQWGNLSIRVRYDRYLVKRDQIQAGLYDLWNGTTQHPKKWKDETLQQKLDWVDQGYLYTTNLPPWDEGNIRFESLNHLQTSGVPDDAIWMFYNVTDLQTGDRATDERVKYWKGVAGNTNTFKIFRNGIEVDPKE